MKTPTRNPRVLVVTPEVTYLPDRMGNLASFFTAKAGGLADVSAALVTALCWTRGPTCMWRCPITAPFSATGWSLS